ncbi:hypothetical protein IW146_006939 [Coemansia sp. RSA 922]|nr:hypothetical protein GGI08_001849 [Coemansia sp. S2]KAJ2108214.1 hypothetical protein IW146_006939 [Coemansia sp. RSA 922]KAJ2353078.1 hypothetical protein GGH92_000885 [Coemansia sp. RSA 2673]
MNAAKTALARLFKHNSNSRPITHSSSDTSSIAESIATTVYSSDNGQSKQSMLSASNGGSAEEALSYFYGNYSSTKANPTHVVQLRM